MGAAIQLRRLGPADLSLIGDVDRSQHVDIEYGWEDGRLVTRPIDLDVPPWDPTGTGEHSVPGIIARWEPLVAAGAPYLGAFDGAAVLGLAIVDPVFEPDLAWLAFLYVSRPYRRRGVAAALWAEAAAIARTESATAMYVSAVPSGAAVGFYLSRGCVPAVPPHPELLAAEPDDIHLICPLR